MPMWERACFISDQRLNRLAAENIWDQSINILDNFLIGFFPVTMLLWFDIGNPTWFANIGDWPYMRAGRKSHQLQAFVEDPLIHANWNISFLQARLRQLIPIADFSKFSYSALLKELKRPSVVAQIPRFIQGCSRAARQNSPILGGLCETPLSLTVRLLPEMLQNGGDTPH
jgi:hypothetical protein